jgi:hypothetical protein
MGGGALPNLRMNNSWGGGQRRVSVPEDLTHRQDKTIIQ